MLSLKFPALGFWRGAAAARRSVEPSARTLHVSTPSKRLFAGISNSNSLERSLAVTATSQPSEAVITPDALAYWRKEIAKVDRCDPDAFKPWAHDTRRFGSQQPFSIMHVCRPGLGGLVGSLDWHHPLGVTRARAKGHVQCYGDFLSAKRQHPKAVVLVRVRLRSWACHGHQGSPRSPCPDWAGPLPGAGMATPA